MYGNGNRNPESTLRDKMKNKIEQKRSEVAYSGESDEVVKMILVMLVAKQLSSLYQQRDGVDYNNKQLSTLIIEIWKKFKVTLHAINIISFRRDLCYVGKVIEIKKAYIIVECMHTAHILTHSLRQLSHKSL